MLSFLFREILSLALTSAEEDVRLFATELLLIHARSGVAQFHKWGLQLLLMQLKDKSKNITNRCLEILYELSYDPVSCFYPYCRVFS